MHKNAVQRYYVHDKSGNGIYVHNNVVLGYDI